MTKQLSTLAAMLLMAALAGCVTVKPEPPMAPVPPSQSVAEADARLATVVRERAREEAAFAASERICYAKFLVTRCLDEAKERRRIALAGLRAIEVEASRFKRQDTVNQRDREIAKAEQDYRDAEARMAAAPPPQHVAPAETTPKAAPVPRAGAAKAKQAAAPDRLSAAERAANVAAYEKRKHDAEQRQREIEEKKKKAVSEGETK